MGTQDDYEPGHDVDATLPDRAEAQVNALAFEQVRPSLQRYLMRQLHRAEDAEDLTQEVYLRLLRLTTTEVIRFPQAYVLRVAVNVLYEFRHRRRRGKIEFDSSLAEYAARNLADDADPPEEAYERQLNQSLIEDLVQRLPDKQQAVLIMATREKMSYEEIAARLNISASTARVHAFRALAFIRQQMARKKIAP